MRLPNSEQMREIERRAAEEAGLPTLLLMGHAGRAVAQVTGRLLRERGGDRVAVVCGKGNNGGDGLCAARHLANAGLGVRVYLLARDQDPQGDAATNLRALRAAGVEVDNVVGAVDTAVRAIGHGADVLVDAIFGTGFRGSAMGLSARAIEAVNESRLPVVAVDVPSGLDADTGRVEGPCVRAHVTVTMALPKVGLLVYPGAAYAGEVVVADLGIPRKLVMDVPLPTEVATAAQVARRLPPRAPEAHKGTYGRVLLVAGSARFSGAPKLAALGALRSGAGLVRLAVPAGIFPAVAAAALEYMPVALPERDGALDSSALQGVLEYAQDADVVALGPGLGTTEGVAQVVTGVVRKCDRPLVLDADALNVLRGHHALLREAAAPVVTTPHPGELGRLLGIPTADVQRSRLEVARSAARLTGAVTLLKGARTLVAAPDGRLVVNPTGNPGMASGGMGDVLTGVVAALIAQGLVPFEAAWVAAYLHGLAADLLAETLGDRGLLAHDVAERLPEAMQRVRAGRGKEPFAYLHAASLG
ncbi:Bifunctional NAD(P)H-hydrate repair enzyme Nnr [bacterium HR32]|nr:Bifunctional NAD(P)H-hydrate repair enzyme Nnr [bacterium HR32]